MACPWLLRRPTKETQATHLYSGDPLISDDNLSYGDLLNCAGGDFFVLPSQLERKNNKKQTYNDDPGRWTPGRVASRALTRAIQAQYDVAYYKWSKIPSDTVTLWFEKFGSFVAWLPEHEYQIKKIFESKGSRRLSEMYLDARNMREKSSWIGEDAWKYLEEESFIDHTLKMAEELGRQPTVDEVFLRTHIRKKDSDWVDLRSKNTYDTFQTKLNQASEGADESGSQMADSATRLKLWAKSAGGKIEVVSMVLEIVPHFIDQLATLEERAKAAEDELRNTREDGYDSTSDDDIEEN
ncbi:hypothetical protein QL285_022234 [Trifolium repens]|nr:hypothetical protein QL285_022234 [Trifolium repens]